MEEKREEGEEEIKHTLICVEVPRIGSTQYIMATKQQGAELYKRVEGRGNGMVGQRQWCKLH